jgi:heat shock protein HslJ
MKRYILIFAALALAPFTTLGGEPNAAGTWKWSLDGQNGDTIRTTLKLKQDGDKLTGSYTNQFGQAEITDGSLKDGEISFKVNRDRPVKLPPFLIPAEMP